jgi:hypothetical protein
MLHADSLSHECKRALRRYHLKRISNRLRNSAAMARLIGYAGLQAALLARLSDQNSMTNEAN